MSRKKIQFKRKPDAFDADIRRYNGYECEECHGHWLTVDLHVGTTPMFSPCFATPGCRGRAVSMGYPNGPLPDWPLLIEWYKPILTGGLSHEMQDYIRRGGLMRRATEDAPEWVKRIA